MKLLIGETKEIALRGLDSRTGASWPLRDGTPQIRLAPEGATARLIEPAAGGAWTVEIVAAAVGRTQLRIGLQVDGKESFVTVPLEILPDPAALAAEKAELEEAVAALERLATPRIDALAWEELPAAEAAEDDDAE